VQLQSGLCVSGFWLDSTFPRISADDGGECLVDGQDIQLFPGAKLNFLFRKMMN